VPVFVGQIVADDWVFGKIGFELKSCKAVDSIAAKIADKTEMMRRAVIPSSDAGVDGCDVLSEKTSCV